MILCDLLPARHWVAFLAIIFSALGLFASFTKGKLSLSLSGTQRTHTTEAGLLAPRHTADMEVPRSWERGPEQTLFAIFMYIVSTHLPDSSVM